MYCLTESPLSWFRRLNLACSNITFFFTWKKASNFSRTIAYLFLPSAVKLVEVRMSSASSLRQYSSVLTCLSSSALTSSEATRNCSNRFFHLGQICGCLKSNGLGILVVAGSLEPYPASCHHVVALNINLLLLNSIYNSMYVGYLTQT